MKAACALLCFLLTLLLSIWGQETTTGNDRVSCPSSALAQAPPASNPKTASKQPNPVMAYTFKIIKSYPHDPDAFTQGLIFENGFLYESTGQNGKSSLRKVELETGRVLKKYDLPAQFFGEGLTAWKNSLIQLTWRSGRGFVYDLDSFSIKREFTYSTEGWGLTHDEKSLIMSNGTDELIFLNPQTLMQESVLSVTDHGERVERLNELEYIKGEIFANIWTKDIIARISPETGEVTGWIDLSGLRKEIPVVSRAEALNGIAYDAQNDRIFVTGKLWPQIFQIEVVKAK
jgi:glutaminyl-peptide cyclotransferase